MELSCNMCRMSCRETRTRPGFLLIAMILQWSLSYRPRALLGSLLGSLGSQGQLKSEGPWRIGIGLGLALVKAGALELLQHLADPMAEVGMTVSPSARWGRHGTHGNMIWRYLKDSRSDLKIHGSPTTIWFWLLYNLNFKRGLDQ